MRLETLSHFPEKAFIGEKVQIGHVIGKIQEFFSLSFVGFVA